MLPNVCSYYYYYYYYCYYYYYYYYYSLVLSCLVLYSRLVRKPVVRLQPINPPDEMIE